MINDLILRACRLQKTDCRPIWLMRQAGRYLPEYRKIRKNRDFFQLCKTPEIASEITAIPVERFRVDAAVIFADIMLPLESIGVPVKIKDDVGPIIKHPIATVKQVQTLSEFDPLKVSFVYDAIRQTDKRLNKSVPIIGFSGAPFTLVSYMVEGGASKSFVRTKMMMYRDRGLWKTLMEKMAKMVIEYLGMQVKAGARVLQLFDSWVGCLGPADYEQFVLPYSRQIIRQVSKMQVPVIHFGTGTAPLLGLMKEAGGNVIGVDWRVDIGRAWRRIGYDCGIQGNLDPVVLLSDAKTVTRYAKKILDATDGRPGHIFNLGHGVLPNTPPRNVKALVDFVHSYEVN